MQLGARRVLLRLVFPDPDRLHHHGKLAGRRSLQGRLSHAVQVHDWGIQPRSAAGCSVREPAHRDGTMYVLGTRVPLDAVVEMFDHGASPEEIVEEYDSLQLDDVYAVVTYYLRHEEDVRLCLTNGTVQVRWDHRL